MEPLSPQQIQVISWIEQFYLQEGDFPREASLKARFPDFSLTQSLAHETFRVALHNRGIKIPGDNRLPKELSPEQVAAIACVLNFEDKRSVGMKLKSLGLTTAMWYGWLQNPVFKDYLIDVSSRSFEASLPTVQKGLLTAAEKGSVDAVKFFYEITGRHSQDSATVNNLKLTIAKLIEAVQRNVKDPQILGSISRDFEYIMRGDEPLTPKEIGSVI